MAFGQIFTDMRGVTFFKWLIYATPVSLVSDLLRQAMLDEPGNLTVAVNLALLGCWLTAEYWVGIRNFKLILNSD